MGRSKALVLFLFLFGSFSAASQTCPLGCRTDVRLSFSSSQHCHCPAGHATGSPCSWAGHGGTYHSPACLDTLPAGFGSGTRLISIKYLRAPTLLECSFPDASGVFSLNIQRSNVSVIQPGAFRGLARAQTLSLADNRISELECDAFIGLEQLKTLQLQQNAISYLSQCAFRGLPLLRDLTLNHNSLKSVPVDSLLMPTALTSVNLNANPITTIDRQIMRLNQNPRLRLTILTIKLNCDRNLTWFICNLALLDLVRYHSSLQCVSPDNLSGTFVTTLKNGAMCSKEWENISNGTDTASTSSESPQLVPNTLPCRQTVTAKTSTETIHTSKAYNHTVHTQDYTNESHTNSTPVSNQTTETDYVILFKRDPIITLDDKRTRLVTMLCAVLVPLLFVIASVIVLFFCKHCHQNYIPAEAATEDPGSPEIVTPYAVAYFETIEPYAVAFAEDDSRQQTSEVNSSNQPEVGLEDAGLQTHAVIHQVADQEPKILPKASIHHETSVPKPHQSKEMTDEPCPELHSQAMTLHDSSGPELQARAVTNSEDQEQELHSRAVDNDDDPGPELQPYAVTYDTRQGENGMGQPYAIAYLPSPQNARRLSPLRQIASNQSPNQNACLSPLRQIASNQSPNQNACLCPLRQIASNQLSPNQNVRF
ncbi:PREDICTED: uncharacterized protein LOC109468415 [Branchiostoma belcheri]|uniref:Uncharacterized protein LOC109468415 n=1 Tax=Branchiostoma belcheri TaxID=7741 RepID=A0A6P4YCS2_BRABE|nr:PREDICTED: uncharacterized protein LOC109468415 [Branchiostoma belcheri]